ncbi:MAG: phosphohydrolase [Candidatus Cloacimonetes bacterium]|nr:phosphohydrolase [Candidatus Cloacimonadota bacterium]MDD4155145.1 phosphohydrolase [Candidatus Cloacimonadota bacterium]
MKKSNKQINLEHKLLNMLSDKTLKTAEIIFKHKELQAMQDYANIVSIKRLGFNDHGPVHMRKAALNSMLMFDLLDAKGIKLNLESEGVAQNTDSKVAVFIASILHDLGMTVARDSHEWVSMVMAYKYIDEILDQIYSAKELQIKVAVRSIIMEGIFGHMATHKIHSLEAGLVLVGDGCDMEEGRARIPTLLRNDPKAGDIHRYSASSIKKVEITQGENKPIKIEVKMSQSVGLFQIEEVLFPKIKSSPVKQFIELYAQVRDQEKLKYL